MKLTDFKLKKSRGEKITLITCYDYPSACIASESNVDCALVGDSVAMVVHGHTSTVMADMPMMVLHTQAVARGLKQKFLISDMPFLGHRFSREKALEHVRMLIQAGAHAVKIEGGDKDTCDTIAYIVDSGVPVIGHIGLTPQSVLKFGGYCVQGRSQDQAAVLMEQAKALEESGCTALVLECIPATLADSITKSLSIPTIGIGAGKETDGQVLVWHDFLGLQNEFIPKFVKTFTPGKSLLLDAVNMYADEVKRGVFPSDEHTYN